MYKYLDRDKIPAYASNGKTISKDLLYEFCKFCDDKDMRKLIDKKKREKKARIDYYKRLCAKVEKSDDFFATVAR